MSGKIKIAVDAMGGDYAPDAIVEGATSAVSYNDKIKIILVGKEDLIKPCIDKFTFPKDRIEIVNATEVIQTDEIPTTAIKQKKDSSIVVGLNLLKQKEADAFVSAGNTGALLTGATLIVGRIKGIERPVLGTLIPNSKGYTFLLDSGANVDCKASYLAQFAKMGSVYMEHVMGIKNPKVGLINIGAEKEKGNSLTKEAYPLLEQSDINFIGNVEARDISLGTVDVAVCDAFVGNVILKFAEGFAKTILGMIKEELMSTTISKVGAFLAQGAFKNLKDRFDYSKVGGAAFIGLNSLVVKAHGNSDPKSIRGAINQCVSFVENDIVKILS